MRDEISEYLQADGSQLSEIARLAVEKIKRARE